MTDIPLKKSLLGLVAVCCTALAGIAAAQAASVHVGLGGGATAPVGDYKDADKMGWHGLRMLQLALPAVPLEIRVDGVYGRTTHNATSGTAVPGSTKLYGGLPNVVYSIGPGIMMRPYVLGGIGMYHVTVDVPGTTGDETKFAFGVGGGVSGGGGQARFFLEGRFVSIRESGGFTGFVPTTAGGGVGEEEVTRGAGGGGGGGGGVGAPSPPP